MTTSVFVAGENGMVGRALCRTIAAQPEYTRISGSRSVVDLADAVAVKDFLRSNRPDQVIVAAAKVGGIGANSQQPAEFLHENLIIADNLIHGAYGADVKRLLFLGSSCIYPRDATQPLTEDSLLCGPLEPTNDAYAIAKIAGIKLCEAYDRQYGCDFRAVMPTNLFGSFDNFDLENAHVLPALLHRMHLAKIQGAESVSVWGSGKPLREFLYVDDLAEACLHVLDMSRDQWETITAPHQRFVNIGYGKDISIGELAQLIKSVVGFEGELKFDASKPDGTPRKLLDSSKVLNSGWEPRIGLHDGIERTYAWFLEHHAK